MLHGVLTEIVKWRRDMLLDVVLYLCFAVFARSTAVWSNFHGYQVWGDFATIAFVIAATYSLWLLLSGRGPRYRVLSVWVVLAIGFVAPLAVLSTTRQAAEDFSATPGTWSAQPNVWVIERSARLLLANGTPYVDVTTLGRAAEVNDYTPYGPLMPVFGLPKALFGASPLTDARLWFALVAVGAVIIALRLLNRPRVPIRAMQLAVISPMTLLQSTTSGEDVAILALIGLLAVLVVRRMPVWAAVVAAVLVSIKLIALPAVAVLIVLLLARNGWSGRFLATFTTVLAAANLPVLLADPGAFVEHAIRFVTGTSLVKSPAASPFPGHLLTELGPAGHVVALTLLFATGLAMLLWLVLRPPTTAADAMWRIVAGMGAAILLMPASRFGYLVYPAVFAGLALFFTAVHSSAMRFQAGEVAPAADIASPATSGSAIGSSGRFASHAEPRAASAGSRGSSAAHSNAAS